MRQAIFCSLLAIASTALVRAQNDAQLVWRGQIDGPTRLRIAGNRVEMENRLDPPSSSPDYRFSTPLPAVRQDVQVLVSQGRVEARVLDQPRANNDFTALVEVSPRRRTAEPITLEFYWDQNVHWDDAANRGRGRMNLNVGPGSVSWSGRVDQEAVIEIRNRRAVATALRG